MSDLVSRLLEAIEARGEKARAVLDRELWDDLDESLGRDWPNWLPEDRRTVRAYMADNDPSSVLRRCEADKRIIARHQPVDLGDGEDDEDDEDDDGHTRERNCQTCDWVPHPCPTLRDVAFGYGITEEEA